MSLLLLLLDDLDFDGVDDLGQLVTDELKSLDKRIDELLLQIRRHSFHQVAVFLRTPSIAQKGIEEEQEEEEQEEEEEEEEAEGDRNRERSLTRSGKLRTGNLG